MRAPVAAMRERERPGLLHRADQPWFVTLPPFVQYKSRSVQINIHREIVLCSLVFVLISISFSFSFARSLSVLVLSLIIALLLLFLEYLRAASFRLQKRATFQTKVWHPWLFYCARDIAPSKAVSFNDNNKCK